MTQSEDDMVHPGEFRVVVRDMTFQMRVRDYASRFQFAIARDDAQMNVEIDARSAANLRDELCRCLGGQRLTAKETATNTVDRLARILELTEGEAEPNRLAVMSFMAGYYGYRLDKI